MVSAPEVTLTLYQGVRTAEVLRLTFSVASSDPRRYQYEGRL